MTDETNAPRPSTEQEILDALSIGFEDGYEENDDNTWADALPADAYAAYLAGWHSGQTSLKGGDERPRRGSMALEVPDGELINTGHYFGACPHCAETDGYLNVGRTHWFVCDKHKTAWCAGSNLFSDWQSEDETIWTANAEKLEKYQEVEPLPSVDR